MKGFDRNNAQISGETLFEISTSREIQTARDGLRLKVSANIYIRNVQVGLAAGDFKRRSVIAFISRQ